MTILTARLTNSHGTTGNSTILNHQPRRSEAAASQHHTDTGSQTHSGLPSHQGGNKWKDEHERYEGGGSQLSKSANALHPSVGPFAFPLASLDLSPAGRVLWKAAKSHHPLFSSFPLESTRRSRRLTADS